MDNVDGKPRSQEFGGSCTNFSGLLTDNCDAESRRGVCCCSASAAVVHPHDQQNIPFLDHDVTLRSLGPVCSTPMPLFPGLVTCLRVAPGRSAPWRALDWQVESSVNAAALSNLFLAIKYSFVGILGSVGFLATEPSPMPPLVEERGLLNNYNNNKKYGGSSLFLLFLFISFIFT